MAQDDEMIGCEDSLGAAHAWPSARMLLKPGDGCADCPFAEILFPLAYTGFVDLIGLTMHAYPYVVSEMENPWIDGFQHVARPAFLAPWDDHPGVVVRSDRYGDCVIPCLHHLSHAASLQLAKRRILPAS